jgi:hypothetical protein
MAAPSSRRRATPEIYRVVLFLGSSEAKVTISSRLPFGAEVLADPVYGNSFHQVD